MMGKRGEGRMATRVHDEGWVMLVVVGCVWVCVLLWGCVVNGARVVTKIEQFFAHTCAARARILTTTGRNAHRSAAHARL